jgi:hypothetical protein
LQPKFLRLLAPLLDNNGPRLQGRNPHRLVVRIHRQQLPHQLAGRLPRRGHQVRRERRRELPVRVDGAREVAEGRALVRVLPHQDGDPRDAPRRDLRRRVVPDEVPVQDGRPARAVEGLVDGGVDVGEGELAEAVEGSGRADEGGAGGCLDQAVVRPLDCVGGV